MRTVAEIAHLLNIERDAIKKWSYEFSDYLSSTASPPKGETRLYDESDLRVLILIRAYWKRESAVNIRRMLDSGDHNQGSFANFARLYTPIFRENRPEDIDFYGPQGWAKFNSTTLLDTVYVARVYKSTGDVLVKEALSAGSYELDYAVLYLYRHAIELYLKVIIGFDPDEEDESHKKWHDLSWLVEKLENQLGKSLPDWMKARIDDFYRIDPKGQMFRYAGTKDMLDSNGNDKEFWIDLDQLKLVMHFLC
ncbi:MAG: hypothetical protein KC449_28975, partial [Anaerolineales bacterium]|nr:hypothetical protein [Anaerolineales bacterium]